MRILVLDPHRAHLLQKELYYQDTRFSKTTHKHQVPRNYDMGLLLLLHLVFNGFRAYFHVLPPSILRRHTWRSTTGVRLI
jgi:hypothetical protein